LRSTTGATGGAGTVYPSVAPKFTLVIKGVPIPQSLVFCVVFCRLLFCPFCLSFCWPLSVLRFTASDYPFGILRLFLLPSYSARS